MRHPIALKSGAMRPLILSIIALSLLCSRCQDKSTTETATASPAVQTGADQLNLLIPALTGKRVGLVANQTSLVGNTHLLDTLLRLGVHVVKVFGPEHGFRGTADPGETVDNALDSATGLPIVSLYGAHHKPTADDLADVDIMIFDIQDVGARFFTYVSTMAYVMEACSENHRKLYVLDRPNPNGFYVDGPVMEDAYKSMVGLFPIPIAHGMTVGELARMFNGEGWLKDGEQCNLEVVPIKNWKHSDPYSLPVKASPNLPNDHSVNLYPSTCLFEGTVLSVGRGTMNPFEFLGHPDLKQLSFQFTPHSIEGMSKNPPFEGQVCYGLDLRNAPRQTELNLSYLIQLYHDFPDKNHFFNAYFEKLAGTDQLRKQIMAGMTEEQIRSSWQEELDKFKAIRSKYLLYK